ncbi:MAG: oligosaccharide repeat unit polymerase, partial [Deltaproteobacteria bacterium]|nr:oligosaccharide repeat unit polymerase [Deltaproteobacteria bacterium]
YLLIILNKGYHIVKFDLFDAIAFLFVICTLVSLFDARNPLKGVLFLAASTLYFLIFYILKNVLGNLKEIETFIFSATILSCFVYLFIIVSAVTLRNRNLLDELLMQYFDLNVININHFFKFFFCMAMASYFHPQGRQGKLNMVFIILFSCGTIALASRSALLIWVLIVSIFLFTSKKISKLKKMIIISVVPLVVFIFIILMKDSYIFERFSASAESISGGVALEDNSFSRLYTMLIAITIFITNPINGVGVGNYGYHTAEALNTISFLVPKGIQEYYQSRDIFYTTSGLLKIAVETGTLGVFIYLLFYYKLFKKLYFYIKNSPDVTSQYIYGNLVALIAMFCDDLFFGIGFLDYYYWLFFALMIATMKFSKI